MHYMVMVRAAAGECAANCLKQAQASMQRTWRGIAASITHQQLHTQPPPRGLAAEAGDSNLTQLAQLAQLAVN